MKKISVLIGALCFIALFIPAYKFIADHSAATAEQYEGLYIFTDCKPAAQYDYLGNVKSNTQFGDTQYSSIRDKMIKKCKKDYPTANGLILHFNAGGADKADAIKFKE